MPKGGNGHGNAYGHGNGNGNGNGNGGSEFLAVAWTDVNGNHNFDPNKDGLIAALVDTNNDHVVSVGDTVTFGTYPHLNGTQAGTFLGADTPVTSVQQADSTQVLVSVADGTIQWRNTVVQDLQVTDGNNNFEAVVFDGIAVGTKADETLADLAVNGPADPDTAVLEFIAFRPGDDGFIDVFIA
jgi:hypothetical protein